MWLWLQMDEDLRMWLMGLEFSPQFDAPTESHAQLVSKLFADVVSGARLTSLCVLLSPSREFPTTVSFRSWSSSSSFLLRIGVCTLSCVAGCLSVSHGSACLWCCS